MRRLPMIIIMVAMVLVSCRRTPSHVIGTGDMARLLADMNVAEGVVDNNQAEYSSDSMKQLLKQSVLAYHGVTQADFDTSLMWYGRHLDVYLDVCDDVIKILEKRNLSMGNAVVQGGGSMSGDSVDVWPGTRYANLSRLLPSRMVSFSLDADNNWERGDIYTWRVKLIDDNNQSVRWTIVAEYDDNTIDWLTSQSNNSGWNDVVFASDSTRTLRQIKGYFNVVAANSSHEVFRLNGERDPGHVTQGIWVDSISLMRRRLNEDDYRYRSRLRQYPSMVQ